MQGDEDFAVLLAMFMYRFALAFLALVVLTPGAGAHGLQSSLQKEVGPYLVDVGYDAYEFESNKETIFNFALIANAQGTDMSKWEFADFDEVRIRFAPEGQDAPEKIIKLEAPLVAYATHTFPSDGQYVLTVKFLNDGKEVSAADFPIAVGSQWTAWKIAVTLVILAINAVFFGVLAWSKFSRRRT
jgi:hypothetical protein